MTSLSGRLLLEGLFSGAQGCTFSGRLGGAASSDGLVSFLFSLSFKATLDNGLWPSDRSSFLDPQR